MINIYRANEIHNVRYCINKMVTRELTRKNPRRPTGQTPHVSQHVKIPDLQTGQTPHMSKHVKIPDAKLVKPIIAERTALKNHLSS